MTAIIDGRDERCWERLSDETIFHIGFTRDLWDDVFHESNPCDVWGENAGLIQDPPGPYLVDWQEKQVTS